MCPMIGPEKVQGVVGSSEAKRKKESVNFGGMGVRAQTKLCINPKGKSESISFSCDTIR